jgi:hypothetical protein
VTHTEEVYEPPPEHLCNVDDGPIDLVGDLSSGERHELFRNVHYYHGRAVFFSLQQSFHDADGHQHIISRVDSEHGIVHRHFFGRSRPGDEIADPRVLVRIPVGGDNVVDAEYERYQLEMIDNWEARWRTWRQS